MRVGVVILAVSLLAAPRAIAAPEPTPDPASEPAPRAAPTQKPGPPPKAPVQGYVSKGVYSRFSFGVGVHIGVNSITSTKPLLGGVSVHFRASGIAGLTIEYDFNRVQKEPTPEQMLQDAKYLRFIPNLRVSGVIYPYRWRMLGPFVLIGMGFDTAAQERSTNLQLGVGLEVTFWRHHLAVVADVRMFLPLPSDVERHRARVQIAGVDTDTSTSEYYNFKNALFTLSLRYYY